MTLYPVVTRLELDEMDLVLGRSSLSLSSSSTCSASPHRHVRCTYLAFIAFLVFVLRVLCPADVTVRSIRVFQRLYLEKRETGCLALVDILHGDCKCSQRLQSKLSLFNGLLAATALVLFLSQAQWLNVSSYGVF